jgi:hypothetical protein
MSHDQALQLQDRLEILLEQFEAEVTHINNITTQEQVEALINASNQLQGILSEVKSYFIDVRNQLADIHGIPPAKELAQLVIGASTEALSAIRETQYNFEELKGKMKGKRKKPLTQEELHYADFSAKVAIRKSRSILKKISERVEDLPDQL